MKISHEKIYSHFIHSSGASIDTRTMKPGDIFFCLRGGNFDGNLFAEKAILQGASHVIIDNPSACVNERCILVENTLHVLQQLAAFHRSQLQIPIIAITGTNGKTTTKELLSRVLSKKYVTHSTQGNLNNHIGVPLTMLKINPTHEIAIIEMGANHLGEISNLCKIANPTHGLITNTGIAHLDGFGSPEGVVKAKTELYEWLGKNNGVAFIHTAMGTLYKKAIEKGVKNIIKYGGSDSECFLELLPSNEGKLWVKTKSGNEIKTNLFGKFNADNVCASLCMGTYFGVSEKDSISAIENYQPENKRSEIIRNGSNIILMDYYNANPTSMKAAILELSECEGKNKVAILGDMLELGSFSATEHENLGMFLQSLKQTKIILCGTEMSHTKKIIPEATYFENSQDSADWLKNNPVSESVILIKGSRGMQMEKIAKVIFSSPPSLLLP